MSGRARFDHLVLDCDGVLWEGTNDGYFKCYHAAAVEAGIPLDYGVARERILKNWGQSAQLEVAEMIPEHPDRVDDVLRIYRRLIRSNLFLDTASLIAGAPEALAELAREYPLSAITGMDADNLQTLLARFGLRGRFRHLLSTSGSDDPARQKPTGYHLRLLLDRERLAPERALCVGDATSDIEMARRQSVPFVAVLTGHLTDAEARRLGALDVIPSIAALPGWLRK
jgi:phosphoglycolate phosphatase-like HAD superfamily hydrolase